MARRILATLLLLVIARPALAWNKPGHMVVGAIAYDVLAKEDPQALAGLVEVLKSHPRWNTFEKRRESVPEADRDRYLFMIAARWADDVRGSKQYNRSAWHYVNSPVFVARHEGKVTPPPSSDRNAVALLAHNVGQAVEKGTAAPPSPPAIGENILSALAGNLRAERTSPDAAERAVAICWVMHLVGDLHQPLHTVALFGVDRPKGDRGGNDFYIAYGRAPPSSTCTSSGTGC